jgi:23S rRNA (uracil1939-C5)-methyltransferase
VKRSFAKTVLVDTNKMNVKYATKNLQVLGHNKTVEVISADVAKVTELIKQNSVLIVDPPRNGLSKKVVEKIIEIRPKHIAYLSCDPVTQARDIALIMQNKNYQIDFVQTYNFFPRTAHIENFVFLSVHL